MPLAPSVNASFALHRFILRHRSPATGDRIEELPSDLENVQIFPIAADVCDLFLLQVSVFVLQLIAAFDLRRVHRKISTKIVGSKLGGAL